MDQGIPLIRCFYLKEAEKEQGTHLTRFRHLQQLANEPLPTDATQQIQWVWLVAIAIVSWKTLHEKDDVSLFPRGNLPADKLAEKGWPSGLLSKSASNSYQEL